METSSCLFLVGGACLVCVFFCASVFDTLLLFTLSSRCSDRLWAETGVVPLSSGSGYTESSMNRSIKYAVSPV